MNNNLIIHFNKWTDYYYKLDNNLISEIHLFNALNSLFELFDQKEVALNTILSIQFKIKFNNHFRSVSYLQTIKLSEYSDLSEIFTEFWNIRDQEYLSLNPSHIVFTYKLTNDNNQVISKSKFNRSVSLKENEDTYNFKGYNLPAHMDYFKWGKVIDLSDTFALIKKSNSKSIYHVSVSEFELNVSLKYKDNTILEFTDKLLEKGKLDSFTRIIKNHEYIFIDGICTIKKIIKETNFLKPVLSNLFESPNFATLDLETRTINNIMVPYAASIYDGKTTTSFYLTDFNNSDDLLRSVIKYLMRPKYHNYKIFIHNFSFFDGIFLLRILSELTSAPIKPIMRDGRIIELKFPFEIGNYTLNLYFRDSYLLLPSSLRKLAINFNVSNKGIFPYRFVNNQEIALNYIGSVPSYEYFDSITLEQYNLYSQEFNNNWHLREETLKYCNQDVITLHEILSKFQSKIYSLFRLDILKYPTLSSLAFAIYRSLFLKNYKIPLIDGELFHNLKKGYTGGAVDMYKPFSNNEPIYRYDVNSLYPFVMKDCPMPVGKPTYFEGDILKISDGSGYDLYKKPFGFFEVEVTAPSDMKVPILQTKVKTKNGVRTIAPLGTWTGTYFSEEIYNAEKHGYKFNILRGYIFDKKHIFTEYVDYLYNLKVNSTPGTPDYIIAKLLLNTLYGRFGMNPHIETHLIITNEKSLEFQEKKVVTNVIDLHNGKELISFFDDHDWSEDENKKSLNISVAVAAAVTASARIHMSKFKTMENFTLYYSDTDSIDINKPLPEKYIGTDLGKMKLEHIFKDAVFLAPKVYGGVTDTYEYVKVKGLKNPVSFDELKPLLIKNNSLQIEQDKWYRNISIGNITIKEEVYTLTVNNLKRNLIYDDNNKLIDTRPLILKKEQIE